MTDLETELSAAEVAGDVESVISKINRRRDEDDGVLTLDIPSWDGDLKARYKTLHRDEVEKMIRRAMSRARANGSNANAGIEADAAFLEKACIAVVAIDPEDGETEHVISQGYDLSLVPILKPRYPKGHPMSGQPVEIKSTTELILYLVKWEGVALASHGQDVARWMQTLKRPIEDPQ